MNKIETLLQFNTHLFILNIRLFFSICTKKNKRIIIHFHISHIHKIEQNLTDIVKIRRMEWVDEFSAGVCEYIHTVDKF